MPLNPHAARQAELWDRWAEHHPHLYPDRDPAPAVAFLRELAGDGEALEFGAGTGRVTTPLAGAGTTVTAIEVSEALIQRLRTNAVGLPIKVVQADMTEYCDSQYALVYAVHSTFFHITDQQQQVGCMNNVARMLAPGGVFVLSCFVPGADLLTQTNNLTLVGFEDQAINVRATIVDASIQTISYREVFLSAAGIRVLPAEQRFCWPSELDLMAQLGGMTLSHRYADFKRNPFLHGSGSHVSVYRIADRKLGSQPKRLTDMHKSGNKEDEL